jgi:cell division protein FtsN
MAAAKRGKQATRGSTQKSLPAWVLIGIGVLMGLALSVLVLFKDWMPSLRKHNQPQPNADATAARESEPGVADESGKPKTQVPAAAPRKTYDFYSVLPEMEVVIPDAELTAKARAEAAKQQAAAAQAQTQAATGQPTNPATTTPGTTGATTADTGAHYVLQAGSFPDAKEADTVKAKLALLGITAKVQTVTVNGKTWNRVRVGPYPSASALETAKKTLSDNGISAIAMKEVSGQ